MYIHPKTSVSIIIILVALFVIVRLPGVHLPYHQDEWKNVSTSETSEGAGKFFAHPPLMQMIFVADSNIFGRDNFRMVPLLFSVATILLLYAVVNNRIGRRAALWSVGLGIVCFYNVWGSLQTDVDGSMLPFFLLLAVYAYDKIFNHIPHPSRRKWWWTLLVVTLLVGFLIKLNFILVIGALILDYLWTHRKDNLWKQIGWSAITFIAFIVVYVGLLYLIQAIYPAFSIEFMLGHANQFTENVGRNWVQIIVQGTKAIYYLSPLLLVPLVFVSREVIKRTRVFWIYIILGCIFYFILFDFSRGALDKYLMFLTIPLAVMIGAIIDEVLKSVVSKESLRRLIPSLVLGIIAGAILLALNFLPHSVVALYPKTEWFSRVFHGEWNVLTPMNGGSGPMGFYISFLFIAASYIASIILVVVARFKKSWRAGSTVILICIGLVYNVVFAEELFYGKINGSAPQVLKESVSYIEAHPEITKVLTFNDIGAGPLQVMGKYAGRIYATPDSEEGYRKKFVEHSAQGGHYLIVEIPKLYKGFYSDFFSTCDTLFETRSGVIPGRVYSCTPALQ